MKSRGTKGHDNHRVSYFPAGLSHHEDEYEYDDDDEDKGTLYMKIARSNARQLEKKLCEQERLEYDNYELGHLYDALQVWKAKEDEGFVHKTLTFFAEHISLPMELFGRKVISAVGKFFKLLGTIFSQSKGIIFLLSASYLLLVLIYVSWLKCCFRSRRNPKIQPPTVHGIVGIPKKSGLGFMSYPTIYGRAINCNLYPNMSSESVPIVGKKSNDDGDNMV
ncbi:unnamed protein product [Orchesella dallaii]|uniref:Uncharacterized protein n=1 Tax=Orchesella dallaii TaxID=48710 RepID=A0ABP1PPR2_9HEXA